MSDWENLLNKLGTNAGDLLKGELNKFLQMAKTDSEDFIKRQGEKMELYLNQLAAGKITKDQFEGYINDIKDLTEMQALKMSVAAKARVQSLVKGITDLIINGLLTLIP
jgi:hypothetical protein